MAKLPARYPKARPMLLICLAGRPRQPPMCRRLRSSFGPASTSAWNAGGAFRVHNFDDNVFFPGVTPTPLLFLVNNNNNATMPDLSGLERSKRIGSLVSGSYLIIEPSSSPRRI